MKLFVAVVAASLVFGAGALAQTGSAFSYQGRATNGGVLIDGTINVQLSLWKDAFSLNAADRIGSVQTLNSVPVSDGVFSVVANSLNEFGINPFNGQAVWLQVAINGVNQNPRRQILSTPYANGLAAGGGATNSSQGTTTLTLINQSTSTTPVGVGTGAGALFVRRGNASGISLTSYSPGALQVDSGNVNGIVSTVSAAGAYGVFGTASGSGATAMVGRVTGILGVGILGIAENQHSVGIEAVASTFDSKALLATAHARECTAIEAVARGQVGTAVDASTEQSSSQAVVAISWGDYSLAVQARAAGEESTALVATVDRESSMAGYFGGPVYINDILGTQMGTGPRVPFEVRTSTSHTLQFRHDGFVPGINVNSTGGNAGILRLRNSMEVWPSDDGTRAGRLDVRNAAGSPTITLNGGNGNINATGTITPSSRRLKESIAPMADALERLLRIEGVRYDWIEAEAAKRGGKVHDIGFVAEQVAEEFPEVVARDETGAIVGMDYSRMTAVAVQAIRQQEALRKEDRARLEAEIVRQQRENEALRARLDRLEAKLEAKTR